MKDWRLKLYNYLEILIRIYEMNRLFEIYIYIFYINEYWIIAKDSRLKLCNYLKEVLIVLYEINQQKIKVYLYLLWKKMKKDWMSRF